MQRQAKFISPACPHTLKKARSVVCGRAERRPPVVSNPPQSHRTTAHLQRVMIGNGFSETTRRFPRAGSRLLLRGFVRVALVEVPLAPRG